MANPTSNFGWQMPTNTDLVKDLPADFEVFGQAVDTSLMDLKGGTTGQVLSKASNTDMDFTWVTSDDANAIQNAIVDAKGDLIAATANDTPARLAVGNNGETLVADSSASTGLRWQGNFAAGKNKVINADFNINQRGFTSATTAGYTFDRWNFQPSGATATCTAETFTLGAAPVAGYESKNFGRITVTTGNDLCRFDHRIEDVRTFAGQTVTLSFWAKGTNPTTAGNLAATLRQGFGTGGSPSSEVIMTQQTFVLTANWTRYSMTFNVPSISGKTLGTNNDSVLAIWIGQGTSVSTDAWTLDLWGVQLEAGNVATAFQTATGTLAGELQAAQRYYQRLTPDVATSSYVGFCDSTTVAIITVPFPNTMRVRPTALETSGTSSDYAIRAQGSAVFDLTAGPTFSTSSVNHINLTATTAATLVAGDAVALRLKTANTSYLGWSAEL